MVFLAGCEKDPPESDVAAYFREHQYNSLERPDPNTQPTNSPQLEVSPKESTVLSDGGSAVFTGIGGLPPYYWTVQDVSRGSIASDSTVGTSAVYLRAEAGDNVVVLEDSRGQKAYALVLQPN